MYLQKLDLYAVLYQEIIDTITRNDDTVVDRAIRTAISEAKSYLSRFDLIALFTSDNDDMTTVPTVVDENLKSKTLDLAAWQLIKLCNPNIDLKLFRTSYEDALSFFKEVQKSKIAPDGWLYKKDDPSTYFPEGNIISTKSNSQRNNHW